MRYIETSSAIFFAAPKEALSHADLVNFSRMPRSEVLSAGFLGCRYEKKDAWKVYGQSVGLGLSANKDLIIPEEIWCIRIGGMFDAVLYCTNKEMLENLKKTAPVQAIWGPTKEGIWGECVMYMPQHPERQLCADELT